MLSVYRIDHVSQVVPELAPQQELLQGLFGFRPIRSWTHTDERCTGVMFEIPGSSVRWEVLAPHGDGSPLDAFLGPKRRPGIHHIAVEVNDLEAARAELQALGIPASTHGKAGADGWFDSTLLPADGPEGITWRVFGPTTKGTCGDERGEAVAAPAAGAMTLGLAGIDHICQAYRDRDELARHYERVFGMREIWRTPDGAHADLADLVLNIPGSSARWEIIMPQGKDSFIEKFVTTRGAAMHHVTFEVRDWDRAMAACKARGIEPFDENQGETNGARWRDAFVHPKSTGGILVQLFWEGRPGVWCRSDKIPSAAAK